MQIRTLRARLLLTIAGAAMLGAMPVDVDLDAAGWTISPSYAFAKDGRDDDDDRDDSGGGSGRGGGDRDGGSGRDDDDDDDSDSDSDEDSDSNSDDDDDDDDSGSDGGEDKDDSDGSDRGGSGDAGDDDGRDGDGRGRDRGQDDDDAGDDREDDDSGKGRGRGRGGDDRAEDEDDDRRGSGGTKVEISRGGIEVERADGAKEEIENGRYERKDPAGRTVEERPATQADIDRLRGLAGPGVVAATRRVGSGSVARVEMSDDGIEVVNNDGTKEEIENGRYERKDAAGRTIEERPARQADVDRLQLAARGARTERRIRVGSVAEVERSAAGVEVVYSTGWKEEVEQGRYELKDPNGNTVVERPATEEDRARMTRLAGG